MKIIVLGAGVTGITTAYMLAARGHEVDVVEQEHGPAMQCSFANGAQLSYSHAEPWANPGALPKVAKWMFKDDAPLVLRPRIDLRMFKWGIQFLKNCTQERADINCQTMLRLGLYSKLKMHEIANDTGINFHHEKAGILHIFTQEKELNAAIKQSDYQATLGCVEHVVDSAEKLFALEPGIKNVQKKLVGGIYSDIDESGDVHLFCENLATYCQDKLGVTFHYDTKIGWLQTDKGQITGVETSRGTLHADAYVMALGCFSPIHLKRVGIKVPIYPMKGYSITTPAWDDAPAMSITDGEQKVVFSKIGHQMRAAGTAEFAGFNTLIREKRITPLVNCMKDIFPQANVDPDDIHKWACLRPQTPDGPPILGKTKYSNLFLNTGHGTLGWTQAPASAAIVADIIEGKTPEIEMTGLGIDRY